MNRSFVLLQPEGTGFYRLGPVLGKGWDRGNWLRSGFSGLGQKTRPSRTFKHYMVRQVSDPDGMEATPTHQTNTQDINANIWGPKDGGAGEILLLVPFQEPEEGAGKDKEGMLRVERCYDHALLVTGYDVLLSTLQGNLSFSTSSASSFASTHAGPDLSSSLT